MNIRIINRLFIGCVDANIPSDMVEISWGLREAQIYRRSPENTRKRNNKQLWRVKVDIIVIYTECKCPQRLYSSWRLKPTETLNKGTGQFYYIFHLANVDVILASLTLT